jgi:hypothetical protein
VKPLRVDLDVIIHECENVSTGLTYGAIERVGFSLLGFEDISKSPGEFMTESFHYRARFVAGVVVHDQDFPWDRGWDN